MYKQLDANGLDILNQTISILFIYSNIISLYLKSLIERPRKVTAQRKPIYDFAVS
jgi:hypothetical protein